MTASQNLEIYHNCNGQLFISNHSVAKWICHPVNEPADPKFEYDGERTFVYLHKDFPPKNYNFVQSFLNCTHDILNIIPNLK